VHGGLENRDPGVTLGKNELQTLICTASLGVGSREYAIYNPKYQVQPKVLAVMRTGTPPIMEAQHKEGAESDPFLLTLYHQNAKPLANNAKSCTKTPTV
jgi:hypothetical protein